MSVWAKVRESLAAGEDPVVMLSNAQLAQAKAPRRPVGRPRVADKAKPWRTYRGAVLPGRKGRVACLNPKCRKRLRCADDLVCCETCRVDAILFVKRALVLLRGKAKLPEPVRDVPDVKRYDRERAPDATGVLAGLADGENEYAASVHGGRRKRHTRKSAKKGADRSR